jgi:hypothetical protein
MLRHGNEAPGEAIKEDDAAVKASSGDEDKTIAPDNTMRLANDMVAIVHRGLRQHGRRYSES